MEAKGGRGRGVGLVYWEPVCLFVLLETINNYGDCDGETEYLLTGPWGRTGHTTSQWETRSLLRNISSSGLSRPGGGGGLRLCKLNV